MMKKTFYAAFVFAALGLTACTGAEETETTETETEEVAEEVETHTYALNAEETTLGWRAAWVMPGEGDSLVEAKHHEGAIALADGEISQTGDDVTGEFTIDLTSIEVTDLEGDKKTGLESHLMGTNEEKPADDFFNTGEFATATVKINSVKDGMADITLNIIGTEMNQTIPVTVENNDGKMMMHGEFDMDMSALNFAMTEPNAEQGNINPEISFHLHLVVDKK